MMVFKEFLRFIEEDQNLNSNKKTALINLIQSSSVHPGLSIQWIRACQDFLSHQFIEKPIREKIETLRLLVRGLKKSNHRAVFLDILKVFIPMSSKARRGVDLQPFTDRVLENIRTETHNPVKGQLVELLLNTTNNAPKIQDYLPGLHHPEESISLQILEFIDTRFGVKGMMAVLKEIGYLRQPPSLFFWVQLLPLVNRHPEIFHYPEMVAINPTTLWPLFALKQQGKQKAVDWEIPPMTKWFKLRLHLISEQNQESQGENSQIKRIPDEVERPARNYFSGKRLELIKQDIERMKRDVTSDHHSDRNSRFGDFA